MVDIHNAEVTFTIPWMSERDKLLAPLHETLPVTILRAIHRSNPDNIHGRIDDCPFCPFWRNTPALRAQWEKITDSVQRLLAQEDDEDLS